MDSEILLVVSSTMVALTSLHPEWLSGGGEGITNAEGQPVPARDGIGIGFDCPCPICTAKRIGNPDTDFSLRHSILFSNPLDGGPPWDTDPKRPVWTRTGDTFETLVCAPSILSRPPGCGWHGYIGSADGSTPGQVQTL